MTDLALPHPGRWLWLGVAAAGVVAATLLVAHAARPAYGVPGWGIPVVAGLLGVLLLGGVARGRERGRALAGAALVGSALPVIVLLALSGPVVRCSANGVSTEENAFMALWSGGTRLSGEMSSAPSGATAGHASGPSYSYSYVCRGERLQRVHLRWR